MFHLFCFVVFIITYIPKLVNTFLGNFFFFCLLVKVRFFLLFLFCCFHYNIHSKTCQYFFWKKIKKKCFFSFRLATCNLYKKKSFFACIAFAFSLYVFIIPPKKTLVNTFFWKNQNYFFAFFSFACLSCVFFRCSYYTTKENACQYFFWKKTKKLLTWTPVPIFCVPIVSAFRSVAIVPRSNASKSPEIYFLLLLRQMILPS